MDYIAEIRAFYHWNTFQSLPADAQALWHVLMHLNNMSAKKQGGKWVWPEEFTVANKTLESILAFSRTQLDRMRNALIQAGRIVYRKGRGNQCGWYRLVPVSDDGNASPQAQQSPFATHNVTQTDTHSDTQPVTQTDTQMRRNPGTLDNYNINNNYTTAAVDAHEAQSIESVTRRYESSFGKLCPDFVTDAVRSYHAQGMAYDVILAAIDRSAASNAGNWRYAKTILDAWLSEGVKTMTDVQQKDREHEAKKQRDAVKPGKPGRYEKPAKTPEQIAAEEAAALEQNHKNLERLRRGTHKPPQEHSSSGGTSPCQT